MKKFYVYKVERVEDYKNTAETIDYDYAKDFERITKIRGYVKVDFYITDTEDLQPNEVCFTCSTGDLIKVIEKITEFESADFGMKLID